MSNQGTRYDEKFKKQLVELNATGRKVSELSKEYEISEISLYKWIKAYNTSGSFKAKDNRTEEENEVIRLNKELKQLRMENDILKQAALIMGRK